MSDKDTAATEKIKEASTFLSYAYIISAWLVPGLGHFFLKKYGRALIIFIIINFLFFFGIFGLKGKLYSQEPGNPISIFAALGQKGVGIPYFILRILSLYNSNEYNPNYFVNKSYNFMEGIPSDPYYEYGMTYAVSAGLLNLLLLFDVYDIALGRKK